MKQFMILHYGFKKPTPEEMAEWNKWFEAIKNIQIDRGGFRGGFKITEIGTDEIPFGEDSLTGYTVIESKDIEKAKAIARKCPAVKSTHVYQVHR